MIPCSVRVADRVVPLASVRVELRGLARERRGEEINRQWGYREWAQECPEG